jgi:hypothetical protein
MRYARIPTVMFRCHLTNMPRNCNALMAANRHWRLKSLPKCISEAAKVLVTLAGVRFLPEEIDNEKKHWKDQRAITLVNNPEVSAIYSPSIVYVSYKLTLDGHALVCFIDCEPHTKISANGKRIVDQ